MRTKLFFLLLATAGAFVGCLDDDDKVPDVSYSQSQEALLDLYPTADNIVWSTSDGYQIANYYYSLQGSKADMDRNSTSWFVYNGVSSSIKKTVQDYDQNLSYLPTVVQDAFNATEYSNTSQWVIDDIDLENDFFNGEDGNYVYEIELNSAQGIVPAKEAELFFDGTTGMLLFSKESLDDSDDNDTSDDIVINNKIIASVNAYLEPLISTGQTILIVSAEKDGSMIEVDVAIMEGNVLAMEYEVVLNATTYEVITSETEIEENYTFATLPDEYKTPIMFWYAGASNVNKAPVPTSETIPVEVSKYIENNISFAEVEFEYSPWEAEFKFSYVNDTWEILANESEVEQD